MCISGLNSLFLSMKKSKTHRGIVRHRWPCYCYYCETDRIGQYIEKKNKIKKADFKEINEFLKIVTGSNRLPSK